MQDTIIVLMNQYGYFGIFLLIMIENIFPPIPSEIILGFGGYMAKTTDLTLFGVVFISTIASCLGASILYYTGIIFNREPFIKTSIKRLIKILRINEQDIKKANQWFIKKGEKTVLFGRFVPVIRSVISIPAGIFKMSFCRFLLLTFIGTFIWNGILTIIGRILGNNWYKIGLFIKKYSIFVIIIFIILSCIFIYFYFFKKKKIYK